ncbi:MAG: glycosyltransferase family 4 protein [Patescibacteria group bacterium]
MKILIITQKVDESDDILGFFVSWIEAIGRKVDKIDVICLAKGKYNLSNNVSVVSLGKEKGFPKIFRVIIFYFYLLCILPRVDGVFVHMAPEYVKALHPLNIFFKKPIVMWYAHIKVSNTAKWAMEHVDYILTPSKESFEMDSPKVIATGHGINTEIFEPLNLEPELDVLAISRISRVKRLETLIEAAWILKGRGKSPSISIYGKPARPEDQEYFAELKRKVRTYHLGNIDWRGSVANMDTPKIYASHRLHVRMQGGGGFGKTELEAMSMGIPSIVPTSVYIKDLNDFGSGLYFKEDDAEELANKIEKVLAWNKKRRQKYATIARKLVVEKHNVNNMAEKFVNLLKSCVV